MPETNRYDNDPLTPVPEPREPNPLDELADGLRSQKIAGKEESQPEIPPEAKDLDGGEGVADLGTTEERPAVESPDVSENEESLRARLNQANKDYGAAKKKEDVPGQEKAIRDSEQIQEKLRVIKLAKLNEGTKPQERNEAESRKAERSMRARFEEQAQRLNKDIHTVSQRKQVMEDGGYFNPSSAEVKALGKKRALEVAQEYKDRF